MISERRNSVGKMKNVAIIMLSIAVVALGGFVLYDKVLKDKNTNNSENENQSNNNLVNAENQNLSADEMYTVYLSNLEKNIKNHFKEANFSDEEAYTYESDGKDPYVYGSIESISDRTADREIYYSIYLHENELGIYVNEKEYKIDSDVLQMFLIEEGQAGWKYLYYIKTDGTVKVVGIDDNIESKVNDVDDNGNILKVNGNFEFKSKKIEKLKNIINVFRGSFGLLSGWAEAIFTDIEGNLFRIDSEGNIIKF